MTRLFGSVCNQPQAFGAVLEPVRSALRTDKPAVRWGLGYVQWGEVCLRLSPRGNETGVDFYEALRGLPTDYVIGAVAADDGLKGNANTPPYRFRRWLFAQEGALPESIDLAAELRAHIPDYLLRNIQGRTAAETVFHLFLAKLHEAGKLDDMHLEVGAFLHALEQALAILHKTIGGTDRDLGNLICTNSRAMIAIRRAGPLYLCRVKQTVDPKRPESEYRAALVVSAEQSPGAGFEEIPEGRLVIIKRDVSTEILDFGKTL